VLQSQQLTETNKPFSNYEITKLFHFIIDVFHFAFKSQCRYSNSKFTRLGTQEIFADEMLQKDLAEKK